MLISVIIPVYNVAFYIEDCIRSVMSQTYTEGVECLIIDDCGQDDSINIAQNIINEYKGSISFCVIHHAINKGLSAARNTGIIHAKGKYLYFLDGDDVLKNNCFEALLEVQKKYPDCEMVQGGLEVYVERDTPVLAEIVNNLKISLSTEKEIPTYSNRREWIIRAFAQRGGLRGFAMTAQNRLISNEFVRNNHLFFKEQILHEDELWNYMLAKNVTRLGICNHNTYIYRIRGNSITTENKNVDQKIRDLLPVWDAILQDLLKNPNKIFTKMLWGYMHPLWILDMRIDTRVELKKRLKLLMKNLHFPTTIGLWFYILRPYSSNLGSVFFRMLMHISVRRTLPLTQ